MLSSDASTELRRSAIPYTTLASLYGALLGTGFFRQLRRVFERLVRRYGIRFDSAADVACGTGLFVHYLRRRGVPVVYGVDRSPDMIRLAFEKNQHNGAHFLLQDFLSLQLPQPVDLITCQFDSLNYLLTADDLLRALSRFHANLREGGHVLFDMITDRPPWQGPGPRLERVLVQRATFVRVTNWDPRRCVQSALVSISQNGHQRQEVHQQRGYPADLVVGLLSQARFNLLGAHDFPTLGPVTPQTARVVYGARRV